MAEPARDPESQTRDYRIAFLRYLSRREEVALTAGYAWGRQAVSRQVSLLDVVQVHHAVLGEVLESTPPGEVAGTLAAASAFLMEVVAPYDMARLGLVGASERSSPQEKTP